MYLPESIVILIHNIVKPFSAKKPPSDLVSTLYIFTIFAFFIVITNVTIRLSSLMHGNIALIPGILIVLFAILGIWYDRSYKHYGLLKNPHKPCFDEVSKSINYQYRRKCKNIVTDWELDSNYAIFDVSRKLLKWTPDEIICLQRDLRSSLFKKGMQVEEVYFYFPTYDRYFDKDVFDHLFMLSHIEDIKDEILYVFCEVQELHYRIQEDSHKAYIVPDKRFMKCSNDELVSKISEYYQKKSDLNPQVAIYETEKHSMKRLQKVKNFFEEIKKNLPVKVSLSIEQNPPPSVKSAPSVVTPDPDPEERTPHDIINQYAGYQLIKLSTIINHALFLQINDGHTLDATQERIIRKIIDKEFPEFKQTDLEFSYRGETSIQPPLKTAKIIDITNMREVRFALDPNS